MCVCVCVCVCVSGSVCVHVYTNNLVHRPHSHPLWVWPENEATPTSFEGVAWERG